MTLDFVTGLVVGAVIAGIGFGALGAYLRSNLKR